MRIVFVSLSYFPTVGGGEISLKLLAEGIAERGHKVLVISFDGDGLREERVSGITVVRYRRITDPHKIPQLLTLIPQVARAMRQWQNEVDLFHVYTVRPLSGAGMYKVLGGKTPVVATLNAYSALCPVGTALCPTDNCHFVQRIRCLAEGRGAAYKILSVPYAAFYPVLTWLAKKADRYIALSKVVKNMYVEHGYDEEKIDVIPNFTEEQINPSVLEVAHKPHIFNILYVGRLPKEKGVNILIHAFSELAKGNPQVQLTIVGEGPEREALKKLASELQMDKQVFFVREVPHKNIWQYYQNADVFVHPAIWAEPFNRTILEAMQFQLPLIVSNVGGPPEMVGDAGLIFEKGSVDDLAQKLELVYRDEKLRQKLSSNCRKVLQNYERDRILDRIIALYQKVLGSSKG